MLRKIGPCMLVVEVSITPEASLVKVDGEIIYTTVVTWVVQDVPNHRLHENSFRKQLIGLLDREAKGLKRMPATYIPNYAKGVNRVICRARLIPRKKVEYVKVKS